MPAPFERKRAAGSEGRPSGGGRHKRAPLKALRCRASPSRDPHRQRLHARKNQPTPPYGDRSSASNPTVRCASRASAPSSLARQRLKHGRSSTPTWFRFRDRPAVAQHADRLQRLRRFLPAARYDARALAPELNVSGTSSHRAPAQPSGHIRTPKRNLKSEETRPQGAYQ